MITTLLFSLAFLLIGLIGGWFLAEKYVSYMMMNTQEPHDFEELFEKNPHPEIFDVGGDINRGEYIYVEFPPGFDPKDMSKYRVEELDQDDEED